MLDYILSALLTAFRAMDTFGREHWGFVLCFVFAWWLLDRLIDGGRTDIRWIIQRRQRRQTPTNMMRMSPRGSASMPDAAQNNPPTNPIQALGRATLQGAGIAEPPGVSSQAGLASFVHPGIFDNPAGTGTARRLHSVDEQRDN
jgi:hypothetical protein